MLTWRPGSEANSIGFILWHQVRCEDAIVQGFLQRKPQLWDSEKWCDKMNLPADPMDIGYGYTAEQLASFAVPQLSDLLAYAEAVRARTLDYLRGLSAENFDEITRSRTFGDLSVGSRLGHLLSEIAEHIGQIAYLRGLQRGLNK